MNVLQPGEELVPERGKLDMTEASPQTAHSALALVKELRVICVSILAQCVRRFQCSADGFIVVLEITLAECQNELIESFISACHQTVGWVAQSVEQRTENPCVGGSIPSPATTSISSK